MERHGADGGNRERRTFVRPADRELAEQAAHSRGHGNATAIVAKADMELLRGHVRVRQAVPGEREGAGPAVPPANAVELREQGFGMPRQASIVTRRLAGRERAAPADEKAAIPVEAQVFQAAPGVRDRLAFEVCGVTRRTRPRRRRRSGS